VNEHETGEYKSFSGFDSCSVAQPRHTLVISRAIKAAFQVNPNETYSKRKISGQGVSRAERRVLVVARDGGGNRIRHGAL
jgi:hypothetical protein